MSTEETTMSNSNTVSRIISVVDDYKYPIVFLVVFLSVWTFGVRLYNVPEYVLPTPLDIVMSFRGEVENLIPHINATLWEAFFGWTVGNLIGITLGAVMAEFTVLKRSIYPYVIMLRSLPVVAFAPLLIIWMGVNTGPILAAATITTFFPSLVNSISGFSSTDQLTKELMHSLNASRWDVFRKVKIYNALPYIFSALRISVALAFVGAVVGEWLVGNQGLGYLIIVANNQLDTLLLFRALLVIGFFATAWFGLMMFLERWTISWGSQASGGATR